MDPEQNQLTRAVCLRAARAAGSASRRVLGLGDDERRGHATARPRPDTGPVLSAILGFPMSDAERIEALYLATLSRYPTSDERQRLLAYVDLSDARRRRDQALADVFWVLINSSEFLVNH